MLQEDEEETHWHHVRLEVVRDRHEHEKCWKKEINSSLLAQFHSNSTLLLSKIDLFSEIKTKILKEICCTQ